MIYCNVYCSIDAAHGRHVFHEFAQEWQQRMPNTPVHFFFLQLDEPDDEAVKEAVKEAVEVWGVSPSTGSGELLWLHNKWPRAYTFAAGNKTHAELAGIAQHAFGLSSVASFPGNPKVPEASGLWYWDDEDGQPSPSSGSVSR